MGLTIEKTGTRIPVTLAGAETFFSRLCGLLGTRVPDRSSALLIEPCNSLHTFGMAYAVDAVFLDGSGTIIRTVSQLEPNRVIPRVPGSMQAIEFAPGSIDAYRLAAGDRLRIVPDRRHTPSRSALRVMLHPVINLFIGFLWFLLVLRMTAGWQDYRTVQGFGLIAVNSILTVLFLTRRETRDISDSVSDWAVCAVTIASSLALRPEPVANGLLSLAAAAIQSAGLVMIVLSLVNLGRSFGIVPANRTIKSRGAYRLIRHPLYASEITFYTGFFLGNASPFNGACLLIIAAGQILRIRAEERILSRDERYLRYKAEIKYKLIPGVF